MYDVVECFTLHSGGWENVLGRGGVKKWESGIRQSCIINSFEGFKDVSDSDVVGSEFMGEYSRW